MNYCGGLGGGDSVTILVKILAEFGSFFLWYSTVAGWEGKVRQGGFYVW